MHESNEKNRENGAEATIEQKANVVEAEGEDGRGGSSSSSTSSGDKNTKIQTQQSKLKSEGDLNMKDKESAEKKTDDKNSSSNDRKSDSNSNAPKAAPAATATSTTAAAVPPPPIMKGTLSCDIDERRHLIRGMWNYENSNVFPPQPFELVRKLDDSVDKHVLPQDGTFHGSFRLAYFHTTSKGKQKERIKVIPETNVQIQFKKHEDDPKEYKVDGKGTNQFGIFHINGTATRSNMEGDNTLHVVLRKRYESSEQATGAAGGSSQKKVDAVVDGAGVLAAALPEPSKSFPKGVVCLRGKVHKEESTETLGLSEVVHRINGMWSAGLDLILDDPQNARGLCNRFEYEHKSSSNQNKTFPVSGRYSGWFDLSNEDGTRTRINERDVTLKFRKNSKGFHNVEGKGSNVFGKYSITGSLTTDYVITIFRHFQPRKLKAARSTASAATGATAGKGSSTAGNAAAGPRRPSVAAATMEAKLKLADVVVPSSSAEGTKVEPITPPVTGTYSAVSRGVLRVNGDGSHTCQGKWAVTREHFTNGQTSNFSFRLEAHFAAAAVAEDGVRPFPLNSHMYKGSFQLKKQGSRYQTIVDQQVVMKFVENNQGSYNVHGKGLNAIGEFNLIGTMVKSGKTGGQVELYRMYPPDKLAAPKAPATTASTDTNGSVAKTGGGASGLAAASGMPPTTTKSAPPPPAPQGIQRRESTRLVKLPSRLEDDDPTAQLARIMDKCAQILRIIRERDVELGAFFSEPVDPVALGIPTYYQVIKEPMDLRTVHRRMESQQIATPETFARLVRLVFENAMTFNIDPAHSVHQAARSLLVLFNQKFRDVDRMVQNVRRTHGTDWDEKGKIKKGDKKRKRGGQQQQLDEPKSLKRRRLEEAQAMAAANTSALAAIVAAAPSTGNPTVSRSEFSMMFHFIQQLQKQVVQTHTALAELCPGDDNDNAAAAATAARAPQPVSSTAAPPAAEPPKKKTAASKRKQATPEPVVVESSQPLSLAEQELLTETINELPAEHLGGVIQIIREAAPVGADEDEIDLEIDQLDARTQRKLLSHVSKFIKKPRGKTKKKAATSKGSAGKKAKSSKSPAPAPAPAPAPPKPKPAASSDPFFAFNKGDSESDDSDDENDKAKPNKSNTAAPAASDGFQLTTTEDHDDDDHDDDLGSGGLAANWDLKPTTAAATTSAAANSDKDDEWRAAGAQAEAAKAREQERKAREEKMKAETEKARLKEQEEAVAQAKEKQKEKEAEEARLKEQKEKDEKEAIEAARAKVRGEVADVEPTVDLGDAQRDIMKQYEQSFLDKDYGSASPSSDFGF